MSQAKKGMSKAVQTGGSVKKAVGMNQAVQTSVHLSEAKGEGMSEAKGEGMDMPPEGVFFKLRNFETNELIYCLKTVHLKTHRKAEYSVKCDEDAKIDDKNQRLISTMFEIVKPTGRGLEDTLQIKPKKFDVVISQDGKALGTCGADALVADTTYWQMVEGTGEFRNCFALKNHKTGLYILRGLKKAGSKALECGKGPAKGPPKAEAAHWKVEYEEMDVVKIDFDIVRGVIEGKSPRIVFQKTFNSTGTKDQTTTFAVEESVTHTSTFSRTRGFDIKGGCTFKIGVPVVANADISLAGSYSRSWTYGTTDSIAKKYTITYPVVVPAGKKITAKAVVWEGTLRVPYKVTLKSKTGGIEVESFGTWSGVTTWDLREDYKETMADSHGKLQRQQKVDHHH